MNPYNYNQPTSPERFYGRWDLVNEISNDLKATNGNSFAIIGGKRCGKTSLLYAIRHRLIAELEKCQEGEVRPLPIFVDILGLKEDSPDDVYRHMFDAIKSLIIEDEFSFSNDMLLPLDINAQLLDEQIASGCGFPEFRRVLAYVYNQARKQYGPIRYVFIIDEIEDIADRDWATELFGQLRSLTTDPATTSMIRFVIAGSHKFLLANRRPGSALLNMLKRNFLEPFSKESSRKLITQYHVDITPELVDEIIDRTGGHPYLIQFMMHHLWDHLTKLNIEEIDDVEQQFMTENLDILSNWVAAIGYSGLSVYSVLAHADDWKSISEIRKASKPRVLIDVGLVALGYHNLITHLRHRKYKVESRLFRSWFIENEDRLVEEFALPISTNDTTDDIQDPPKTYSFQFYGDVGDFLLHGDQQKTVGLSVDDVKKLFDGIYLELFQQTDIPPENRLEIQTAVNDIRNEIIKPAESVNRPFLQERLHNLKKMAPDILDVILAAMTNPVYGFSVVAKKIADKMKEETEDFDL